VPLELKEKQRCLTFLSLSRLNEEIYGEKEGPTLVIYESLSKQEKASWLEKASTTHDLRISKQAKLLVSFAGNFTCPGSKKAKMQVRFDGNWTDWVSKESEIA